MTYMVPAVDENGNITSPAVVDYLVSLIQEHSGGGGSSASLIQGWDGLYVETESGVQRVEATNGPKHVAYARAGANTIITGESITDALGALVDLTGKTELYLLSQDDEGNPVATGWVRKRVDPSSPWTVDPTNTAWDGTVLRESTVVAWGQALDSYTVSLKVESDVNPDFLAPYTQKAPNNVNGSFSLPYVTPPLNYIGATSDYVDIGRTDALDKLTRIPLKLQVPNTYYQTVGSGVTPWTPNASTVPGSTVTSRNCPPGSVVNVVGGTQGAYEWTKVLGANTSTNTWKVTRGDTGLLDIGAWSRSKVEWNGQGTKNPVVQAFRCQFRETGMSVYATYTNMDTNTINVAIPYWFYSPAGQNVANSSSAGNIPRDLKVSVIAEDSSGATISNPRWTLTNTNSVYGVVSIATDANMATLELRAEAPITNWPSIAVLDALNNLRPKI